MMANKALHRSWLAFRFSTLFPSFTFFSCSIFTRVGPPTRRTWSLGDGQELIDVFCYLLQAQTVKFGARQIFCERGGATS